MLVQDADLEYDPGEYGDLLAPLLDDRADVVYGSRFLGGRPHRVLYFWHSVGNKMLTIASNMVTDLNLTDMETCYKAFRREVLESFVLEEDRFGIEPEITAKVAAGNWRLFEIGISYSGRTYDEGKKIGWKDGVRAIYCIARYSGPVTARRERRNASRDGRRSAGPAAPRVRHLERPHVGRDRMDRPAAGRRAQVLPVDLLGHGEAPKPHDPAAYDRSRTWCSKHCPTSRSTPWASRSAPARCSCWPRPTPSDSTGSWWPASGPTCSATTRARPSCWPTPSSAAEGAGDRASPVAQYFRGQAAEPGNDRVALAACLRRPSPTAITDEGLARIT